MSQPVLNTKGFKALRTDHFPNGVMIPEYQRRFDWKLEQYEPLWDDIINCKDNGQQSHHFVGPLVLAAPLQSQMGPVDLVDGQQRFCTISLLTLAIKHALTKHGDHQNDACRKATGWCEELLEVEDENGNSSCALTFSHSADQGSYRDLYERDPNLDLADAQQRDSRILKCYRFFREKIEDEKSNSADREDFFTWCKQVVQASLFRLGCLPVTVVDEEAAFTVFETINYQGKRLNQSDLVKNLLLRLCSQGQRGRCVSHWATFMANAEESNADPLQWAWYWWTANPDYGSKTKRKSLYQDVRKKIDDEAKALKFANELAKMSDKLKEWSEQDLQDRPSFLPDKDKKICPFAQLSFFGYRSPYSVLLQLWDQGKNCNRRDAACEELADIMARFLIRNRSICGAKCEEEAMDAVREAMKPHTQTFDPAVLIADVKSRLKSLDAEDSAVKRALQKATLENNTLPKGLLYLHEAWHGGDMVAEGPDKIDLEHVLPKSVLKIMQPDDSHDWIDFNVSVNSTTKPIQKWVDTNPDFPEKPYLARLVYSIGNLALLNKGKNRGIKDKAYPEKRDVLSPYSDPGNLRGSKIQLTAELGKGYTSWTEANIAKRAKSIAAKLVARIPSIS